VHQRVHEIPANKKMQYDVRSLLEIEPSFDYLKTQDRFSEPYILNNSHEEVVLIHFLYREFGRRVRMCRENQDADITLLAQLRRAFNVGIRHVLYTFKHTFKTSAAVEYLHYMPTDNKLPS